MIFTVEDTTLIGAFDHSSRVAAIVNMLAESREIEDPALKDQVNRTVEKLKKMTDDDFIHVDFTVYDKEDGDEQVG